MNDAQQNRDGPAKDKSLPISSNPKFAGSAPLWPHGLDRHGKTLIDYAVQKAVNQHAQA